MQLFGTSCNAGVWLKSIRSFSSSAGGGGCSMGRSMFRAFGQMVPGPGKANGGEDAFFISGDYRTLGLADGVGGWSSMGVDPGKYARLLMKNVEESNAPLPVLRIDEAHRKTKILGGCTACVVSLDDSKASTQGIKLKSANLGDSGFIVLRKMEGTRNTLSQEKALEVKASLPALLSQGKLAAAAGVSANALGEVPFEAGDLLHSWQVVWRTVPQTLAFNTPYQLDQHSDIQAKDADIANIPVEHGDLVIMATDGLWDNVFDEEIVALLEVYSVLAGTGDFDAQALQAIVEDLCAMAVLRGKDEKFMTPFAKEAFKAFYRFAGGKPDDVTVIGGVVSPSLE